MIALISREFRRNKISFITYCLFGVAFAWLYIALFPSIQKQSAQIDQIMKSLPPAMMDSFGIDKTGFNTVEKFLATELMSILWPILAILFSLSRTGAAIAGSIENRTLGLELSLPTSRPQLYLSKLFGQFCAAFIFCSITILSIIPICILHGIEINISKIILLTILCILFGFTLSSLGLMLSAFTSSKGTVFFSAGAIIVISYVSNIVSHLNDTLKWLQYLSLFHYFSATDTLANNTFSFSSAVVFISIILVTTTIGLTRFHYRDIAL